MSIKEKLEQIKSGKLTAEKNIEQFLEKIKKGDNKINSFLDLNPKALDDAKAVDKKIKAGKAGKLAGLAIAIKSNINVQGLIVSCASKTLDNYRSGYYATVIKKIKKEDGIIIGMTNMDEFACGSSGETSSYGPCQNPSSLGRIPGGSSSGSAAAVAAGFCDLSLGSDTGGSIRNPASHCGVVGVKPSYGCVSRYGLIDLSMSLEQIGPFSKDIWGAELLFEVIRGSDDKDPTTYKEKTEEKELKEKLTIGMSPDLMKLCGKEIYALIETKVKELCKKKGYDLKPIKLEHINLAVQTYYPICYVEFFSGTRKFDGRKYGKRIEDVCGPEVLRRILGGSEISKAEYGGKYYRRALKAKEIIKEEFNQAFKKVDVIICPIVPKLPHEIGSKISLEEMYGYDALTVPANLAEIPAMSIPIGKISSIPVGLQIMSPKFSEKIMFKVGKEIEKLK